MNSPAIIMVAPNGARKTHHDHAALPVSIAETVAEASACYAAGATVLHGHVRGDQQEHVLDVGRYRELIAEMAARVPQMLVQITSEAVGRFTAEQQADRMLAVAPQMASVAVKEISSDYQELAFAQDFYARADEAGIHIQHILYSAEEFQRFLRLRDQGVIPATHRCVLFVLGRYATDFQSSPDDLTPFLAQNLTGLDWFTCAFGAREQDCVIAGIDQGGHARVGFENNLLLPDGSTAASSAALVADLGAVLKQRQRPVASAAQARQLLGLSA